MKKFFLAIIAFMMTANISAQFYIYLSNGEVLQADSISVVAPPPPVVPMTYENGTLPGEFSVSDTTKVHFSQGNLQYVGTWQFATNQWECFCDDQATDHRDVFGWGTGDAPNKALSSDNSYSTYTEWGSNVITNGGNIANLWRTLTEDEWRYLLFERNNADALYGLGSVNGMNGVILLPDNWTLPGYATFVAGGNDFTDNTYNEEQWTFLQSYGAVFLPAAGVRDGMGFHSCGSVGPYWSSTPGYTDSHAFYFDYGYGVTSTARSLGFSVRLVR